MELAFVAPVSWSTSPVAPPTGIAAPSVQQPGARGAATVAVGAALAAVVAAKRTGRSARRAQEMATLPKQTGPSGKYVLFFFWGGGWTELQDLDSPVISFCNVWMIDDDCVSFLPSLRRVPI